MGLFATTSWSLISSTREPGDTSREAVASLCRQYWRPLYVYARRAGQPADQAEDVVQDFMLHVIEDEVFARADANRGRFRTFLLTALQQFLARRHRDETRQKRAPSSPLLSLDVESGEELVTSVTGLSAEGAFDRAWALEQLDLTRQRVEAEFAAAGKADLFARLQPMITGASAKEAGASLGMTEGAINVATHRLRRRFGELLRDQVAQTLSLPEEVDAEIAHLRSALAAR
jgi:RNA polymerase sigma-70 factor (ECF subfamily)